MKNWKSTCPVGDSHTSLLGRKKDSNGFSQRPSQFECTLSKNKNNFIELFISELSTKYYHNKRLVNKVLAYINISIYGLSESEILALLSTDKELLNELAPNDFHDNIPQEIPIVHWSRLYGQLKPFLRPQIRDGEVLLCFFHREFENNTYDKNEHEALIKAIEIKILESKDFDKRRWGKLHITSLMEYVRRYKESQHSVSCSAIIETKIPKEVFGFLKYLNEMSICFQKNIWNIYKIINMIIKIL